MTIEVSYKFVTSAVNSMAIDLVITLTFLTILYNRKMNREQLLLTAMTNEGK